MFDNGNNKEFNDLNSRSSVNNNKFDNLNNKSIHEFSSASDLNGEPKETPNYKEFSLETKSVPNAKKNKLTNITRSLIATTSIVLITVAAVVPELLFPNLPSVANLFLYNEEAEFIHGEVEFKEEVVEPENLLVVLYNDFEKFETTMDSKEQYGYFFFESIRPDTNYNLKVTYSGIEIYKESIRTKTSEIPIIIPNVVEQNKYYRSQGLIEIELSFDNYIQEALLNCSIKDSNNEIKQSSISVINDKCIIMFEDFEPGNTYTYEAIYNEVNVANGSINIPQQLYTVDKVDYRYERNATSFMADITFTDIIDEETISYSIVSNGVNIEPGHEGSEERQQLFVDELPTNECDIEIKCSDFIIYSKHLVIPENVIEVVDSQTYYEDSSARVVFKFNSLNNYPTSVIEHDELISSFNLSFDGDTAIGYINNIVANDSYIIKLYDGDFIIYETYVSIPESMMEVENIKYDLSLDDLYLGINIDFNKTIDSSLSYGLYNGDTYISGEEEKADTHLQLIYNDISNNTTYVLRMKYEGIIFFEKTLDIPSESPQVDGYELVLQSDDSINFNISFITLDNPDNIKLLVERNGTLIDSQPEILFVDELNGYIVLNDYEYEDSFVVYVLDDIYTINEFTFDIPTSLYKVTKDSFEYSNSSMNGTLTINNDLENTTFDAYYLLDGERNDLRYSGQGTIISFTIAEFVKDKDYQIIFKQDGVIIYQKVINLPSNSPEVSTSDVVIGSVSSVEIRMEFVEGLATENVKLVVSSNFIDATAGGSSDNTEEDQEFDLLIENNASKCTVSNLNAGVTYRYTIEYNGIILYNNSFVIPSDVPTILSLETEGGGSGGSQTVSITFDQEIVDDNRLTGSVYYGEDSTDTLTLLISGTEAYGNIYNVPIGETYKLNIYYQGYLIYSELLIAKN